MLLRAVGFGAVYMYLSALLNSERYNTTRSFFTSGSPCFCSDMEEACGPETAKEEAEEEGEEKALEVSGWEGGGALRGEGGDVAIIVCGGTAFRFTPACAGAAFTEAAQRGKCEGEVEEGGGSCEREGCKVARVDVAAVRCFLRTTGAGCASARS